MLLLAAALAAAGGCGGGTNSATPDGAGGGSAVGTIDAGPADARPIPELTPTTPAVTRQPVPTDLPSRGGPCRWLGPAAVGRLAYTNDGRVLVTEGEAGVRSYDAATGAPIAAMQAPHMSESPLSLSADGALLAFASSAGASVSRLADGSTVRSFAGTASFAAIALSPDGATAAVNEPGGAVARWNVSDGSLVDRFAAHPDDVTALAFSPDGRLLATADALSLRLWRLADHTMVAAQDGGPAFAMGGNVIEFSRDGMYVAVSSGNGTIVFRTANLERLTAYAGWGTFGPGAAEMVLAENRGERLITLAFGGDPATTTMRAIDSHANVVAAAPDGQTLALASSTDRTLFIAPAATLSPSWVVEGGQLEGAAANDTRAVTLDAAGVLRIWRLDTAAMERKVTTGLTASLSIAMALSPDGTLVAYALDGGTTVVWDLAGNRMRTMIAAAHGTFYVTSVGFSRDGKTIVTAGADQMARVWRVSDGGLVLEMFVPDADRPRALFGPDDRTIVAAGFDLDVFDASSGVLSKRLDEPLFQSTWSVSASADVAIIADASTDGWVRLFRTADWSLSAAIEAHPFDTLAAVTPDGARLVTVGSDDLLRIWRVADATLTHTLSGATLLSPWAIPRVGGTDLLVASYFGGPDVVDLWCLPPR